MLRLHRENIQFHVRFVKGGHQRSTLLHYGGTKKGTRLYGKPQQTMMVPSDGMKPAIKWRIKYPVGAYGFIRASKPGAASHVMAWERWETGIVTIDSQVNTIGDESYLSRSVADSVRWVRIDGYRPGLAVIDVVEGA